MITSFGDLSSVIITLGCYTCCVTGFWEWFGFMYLLCLLFRSFALLGAWVFIWCALMGCLVVLVVSDCRPVCDRCWLGFFLIGWFYLLCGFVSVAFCF